MQVDTFMAGEGDRYFDRQKVRMLAETPESDAVIRAIRETGIRPELVLEIGCSNGWRLALLNNIYGCESCGVDPSAKAIMAGQESYPNIFLEVGTADSLPYKLIKFDLVIFGFCLYLCDREHLFKIAYEADRVLMDGGYLILLDWYSAHPYKNPYSHCEGTYSYKMDYSKMFSWNPAYHLRSQRVFSNPTPTEVWADNDIAVTVFHKNV